MNTDRSEQMCNRLKFYSDSSVQKAQTSSSLKHKLLTDFTTMSISSPQHCNLVGFFKKAHLSSGR